MLIPDTVRDRFGAMAEDLRAVTRLHRTGVIDLTRPV
jgi:hypothetical protein